MKRYFQSKLKKPTDSRLSTWQFRPDLTCTAIIPVVFRLYQFSPRTVNLDIGGGRFNLVTNYLKDIGVTNLIYDPFCRDSRENQATVDYLIETGLVDTVTCCNVLNVIPSEQERAGVILMAALALKEGGKAFFQVYEKDKHGTGTVSLRRTYQTNRRAREYLEEVERFFDDVVVKKNILVASWPNYACCRESGQLLYNQGIQYQLQGDRFEAGSVIDLSELLRRD